MLYSDKMKKFFAAVKLTVSLYFFFIIKEAPAGAGKISAVYPEP